MISLEIIWESVRQWKLSAKARLGAVWIGLRNADCFSLLEVLNIIGACSKRPARNWQKMIWCVMHALTFAHCWMFTTNMVQTLTSGKNFQTSVWHVTTVCCMTVVLLKLFTMRYHTKTIQQVRQFVESKFVISGDVSYDADIRNRFMRQSRLTAYSMILVNVIDYICLLLTPNLQRERLFPVPLGHCFGAGSILRRIAHDAVQFSIPVWAGKYLWNSGIIFVLLLGLRSELKILAHKLEVNLERMQSKMTSTHFDSSHHPYRWQERESFWKQLNADVGLIIEQHVELERNIQLLQSSISASFSLFYSFAIIGFAAIMFAASDDPFSIIALFLGLVIGAVAVEGYVFCHLVDSFQDLNESIHVTVYEMCAQLPYDAEHCISYRRMRSSLMTVAIYTANAGRMTCAGIFDINMNTFAEVLNTTYDILKFLLGMKK